MSTYPRPRTGLVLPGVTVALTPARAATSRLRRRYHERYRGRYKFPALLFGIDLLVVACVVAVFGVGVWLSLWKPQEDSGLQLVFSAPPITTATTIAFEAVVSARDGRMHPDVRLRWVLPPGTEIASFAPQIDAQNEVLLGDLYPGEERHARLAVRLFLPPGSVRIGFQVRSGDELLSGEEVRPIVGSALRLEQKLLPIRSAGSETLFILHNDGNIPLDCGRVRARGFISTPNWDLLMGAGGNMSPDVYLAFDEIAPQDRRLFFLTLSESQEIRVFCGETEVSRLSTVPPTPLSSSPVQDIVAFPSVPAQDTVALVTTTEPLQLLVYHPLLREADNGFRIFSVASGTSRIVLPLDPSLPLPHHGTMQSHWFVWPIRRAPDGLELLGRVYDAPITTPFSLQAEARYYAASGGPNRSRASSAPSRAIYTLLDPVEDWTDGSGSFRGGGSCQAPRWGYLDGTGSAAEWWRAETGSR